MSDEITERLLQAKKDYADGKITLEQLKQVKEDTVAARSALREAGEQAPPDGLVIHPETISTGSLVRPEGA